MLRSIVIFFLFFSITVCIAERRIDGAIRLTFSDNNLSCQNPAFSPDENNLMFTRFINGYNVGPSEIIKLYLSYVDDSVFVTSTEIIIPHNESDNVNVPGPTWIDGKICWASDRNGGREEIFISNDDGSGIEQLTNHSEGSYIEPVFNPMNTNKIIFEISPGESDTLPHLLAILERDKQNKVTILTNGTYDDRLPSWSWNGERIIWQRADKYSDNWQIYTALIDYNLTNPILSGTRKENQPSIWTTDNSFFYDNKFILTSADPNNTLPNILAIDDYNGSWFRVTWSQYYEDSAPCTSPTGKWIAFESHKTEDANSPSEIWIIKTPIQLLTNVMVPNTELFKLMNVQYIPEKKIKFQISIVKESILICSLYDIIGNNFFDGISFKTGIGVQEFEIPIDLNFGIYLLSINDGSQTELRKIIISE